MPKGPPYLTSRTVWSLGLREQVDRWLEGLARERRKAQAALSCRDCGRNLSDEAYVELAGSLRLCAGCFARRNP